YKKVGCEKCNYTGYLGRVLIYERVILDKYIKEMILKGCSMDRIRKYTLEKNKTNLEESALDLVRKGKTSIEELEKLNF
ncbi:MAG: type II secretion system protein GspE, partial [Clostridium cochlearium]|nr:type II secretion system protein GspE [Clostridium cochlearium]